MTRKMEFLEVHEYAVRPVAEWPVEIVERKGLGHPDTICDGVIERFGYYLMKWYVENFDVPCHYNVDKCVLVGGRAAPRFGGGEILSPIIIHIAGRATESVKRGDSVEYIPVEVIARKALVDYIKEHFRYLDPVAHVTLICSVRPGSADLRGLFEASRSVPLANDTSVGAGFWPLTPTERICLETERLLNSREVKQKFPAVGEDIKVMCVRRGRKLRVTIAAAIISRHVRDLNEYMSVKREIKELVMRKVVDKYSEHFDEVEIHVNTADKPERGIIYLTVTGTSAEHGDDGQAGRGNRWNGLITPMRPMSIEAHAGKNAFNHVGKIYQVFATNLAKRIVEQVDGVKEATVIVASTIGQPITEPQILDVSVVLERGYTIDSVRGGIESVVEDELERLPRFWEEYVRRGPSSLELGV